MSSIYIHYPFCKSKCPYCDFNSHVRNNIDHQLFAEAYLKELEYFAGITDYDKIKSVFFGGGTPSLMPVFLVEKILNKISSLWSLSDDVEISLEANPNSAETENLSAFRKAGINRLSLGIQSLNEADLKFLGRLHNAQEARKALNIAGKYFDNFSFDLIYARSGQDLASWREELNEALKFNSPHLSLYQLTIEKGTEFFSLYKKGQLQLPESKIQDDLYDLTAEICERHGLKLYEVSNYARAGFECYHNLNYWQYGDYLGIGAGAHGRVTVGSLKKYMVNYHLPEKWLKSVLQKGFALQSSAVLNSQEILEEILIMGLRTKYGINNRLFRKFLGKDYLQIFGKENLDCLVNEKLITYNQQQIRPTLKGLKLVNRIYLYLLKNSSLY